MRLFGAAGSILQYMLLGNLPPIKKGRNTHLGEHTFRTTKGDSHAGNRNHLVILVSSALTCTKNCTNSLRAVLATGNS